MAHRHTPRSRHAPRETVASLGEFGLIGRIQRQLRQPEADVRVGIGDDTAVIDTGGPALLLATVDMQVEGRHFLRARTPPELLGRRVGAVNLSDIAAMGGVPRWALVSLALPSRLPVRWVDSFYSGLDQILGEFGAYVVGGNLSGAGRISADLTLLGEVARDRVLTRRGASPGDAILVTGSLGRSAVGRAALDAGSEGGQAASVIALHRSPWPRVREGQAVAAAGGVTAMIDLSDGLAGDLPHILDASGCGATIDARLLPIADDTRSVAVALGLDPLTLALAGGEDFELLLTASPQVVTRLRAAVASVSDTPLTQIGEVRPSHTGRTLTLPSGVVVPLRPGGWDHFLGAEC